jgi:hypothetical protein
MLTLQRYFKVPQTSQFDQTGRQAKLEETIMKARYAVLPVMLTAVAALLNQGAMAGGGGQAFFSLVELTEINP